MDWSPKRYLASRLTDILRSYCPGVDIESVHTNLLTDNRVELENVLLRDEGISGSVDSIAFSWKWGSHLSSLGIREGSLEVRGVRIRTSLESLTERESTRVWNKEEIGTSQERSSDSSFFGRYLDEHIENLLDSLGVKFFDVQIVLDNEIVLTFDKFVLEPLEQKELSSSFSKRLYLHAFTLHCRSGHGNILEPFSYSVSVNRVNSKRFHRSTSGFEVIGETPSSPATLNTTSLQALLPLLRKLERAQRLDKTGKEVDCLACNGTAIVDDNRKACQDEAEPPTRFVLPIPNIVLRLPNSSHITLHETLLSYTIDGSVFQVSGSRGVSCNGWSCFRVSEGAVWSIDMNRRSFSIVRDGFVDAVAMHVDDPLVAFEWLDSWGLAILEGLLQLKGSLADGSNLPESTSKKEILVSTLNPWTMDLCGSVSFKWRASNGKWMVISFDNPTVHATLEELESAQANIMTLSSFDGTHVLIPDLRMEQSFGIQVAGDVSCRLQSCQSVSDIAEFLSTEMAKITEVFNRCVPPKATTVEQVTARTVMIPVELAIPKLCLSVEKEGIYLALDDLGANQEENEMRCSHILFTHGPGTILAASCLTISMNDRCYMTLDAVESLYIPGVFSITTPIRRVGVRGVLDGYLEVIVPTVSLMLLESTSNCSGTRSEPAIPCPIRMKLSELSIESRSKRLAIVHGASVQLETKGGLWFKLSFELESQMVRLLNSSVSGVLGRQTVHNLRVQPGHLYINTSISTFDWSLLTGKKSAEETVWNLPWCLIDSFTIQISLQEESLSTGKPHRIAAYQGGPKTTSHCADLKEYCYKLFMNEFPHLYTKTVVLGERATDLTAKAAGRLAGSTLAGSTFGSVGALMVFDSVRTILSLGRKGRIDADENKLKSNDVILGIWRATKMAAKKGGRLRRGEVDYHYEVGDVVYGASSSFSSYVQENSTRFGSAVFSALGVACGGALYGFGGMMVGNILGGQAGALLFKKTSAGSPPALDNVDFHVECLEDDGDDSGGSWLVILPLGECELSAPDRTEGEEEDGRGSLDPVDESGTKYNIPTESAVGQRPNPSAPIASADDMKSTIDGVHLQPAREADCSRGSSDRMKLQIRKFLGLGPYNRQSWTKA